MTTDEMKSALIVGAGPGLSAAIARKLSSAGWRVALAARDVGKLAATAAEIGGEAFACDASSRDDVGQLFATFGSHFGAPDAVVYNPSARARGPLVDLDPETVERALLVTAYGGFLVGQQAARAMAGRGSGTIIFTGASASVKGYAESASFAMGKFALRGLAQSMARELGPRGIHVAHVVIDGGIGDRRGADEASAGHRPDDRMDPDAIADAYLHLIAQPRSTWTHELDVRPWMERF